MPSPVSPIPKLRQKFRRPLLGILLGVVILGNFSCDKQPKGASESAPPEENALPALARDALAHKPAAQGALSAPRAPATTAATYYVIKRVSVTTDFGIQSVPLGTPVQVTARTNLDCKIRLTDGTELTVTPDQLTNDANLAKQIATDATVADAERADAARARAAVDAASRRPLAAANTMPQASTAGAGAVPPAPAGQPAQATPPVWYPLTGTMLDQKAASTGTVVNPPRKKK